jgi:hypothetical protein
MLVVNYEQLLRDVFSCFHGQKFNFSKQFLHCRVRTKKLLDTKVEKMLKEFWNYFWGVKNCFFRASCFGFIVQGVCPLLLPLVSLVCVQNAAL